MAGITQKREIDLSLLKIFSTLLVVFGHSYYTKISSYLGGVDYSQAYINNTMASVIIRQVISIIYSFHMPLFVFISGAVYYLGNNQLDKRYSGIALLCNKFKRLIIPYFIVSLLYMVPIKLFSQYFHQDIIAKIIKYGVFLGLDAGHLWYLIMLFNLFIVFNMFEKEIIKINPSVNIIIMFWVYWKGYNYLPNVLQISAVAKYLIYFYIGYLFQKNKDELLKLLQGKQVIFLIGIAVYYFVFREYSRERMFVPSETGTAIIRSVLIILNALLGIAFSYLLISFKSLQKKSQNKIIRIIDKYCFEIYLLHDPINYMLLTLFLKLDLLSAFSNSNIGAIMFVFLRFFITLMSALLIAMTVDYTKNRASNIQRKLNFHIGTAQ